MKGFSIIVFIAGLAGALTSLSLGSSTISGSAYDTALRISVGIMCLGVILIQISILTEKGEWVDGKWRKGSR